MILTVYRWLLFVVFGWTEFEIQLLEDTLANQLFMSRMNFYGFKKQRAVGQLAFETVPQVQLITVLVFSLFFSFDYPCTKVQFLFCFFF